jgi:hypothetical protein
MPTRSIEASQNLESAAPRKAKTKPSGPSRRKPLSGAANPKKTPPQPAASKAMQVGAVKTPVKAEEPSGERLTKRERMLTLLSHPEGASIEEMMQATNWQQHSVRGFLAGTVKKKLGFVLTSSKPDDGVRRYHIETRRGRCRCRRWRTRIASCGSGARTILSCAMRIACSMHGALSTRRKDKMGTGDGLRGQTEHCIMAVRGRPVVKAKMGTGDWLLGQTEHCIMAVRGRPVVELTNQSTALSGPLRADSQKPDQFYEFVESLCPAPRYASAGGSV